MGFSVRIRLFRYILLLFFLALLGYLFKVQIIDGETYRRKSENNRIRLIPIKSVRGRILDQRGRLLADNRPSFDLYVIPRDFFEDSIALLSSIVDIPQKDLEKKIYKKASSALSPRLLKRDLNQSELLQIEERNADFGGLFVEVVGRRYYPYGEVGAHIVGYLGKINRKEYDEKKPLGYLIDDYIGRQGIERIFEEVLRGEHGGKQIEVNARGHETRVIAHRQPYSGSAIAVSIDIELQKQIFEVIGDQTASVCIMDIKSGEIVALVSTPSYDPNAFISPSRSDERVALFRDKSLPFLNRAISSSYPPGSIFKLVVALAALETGKMTPQTTVNCTGSYRLNKRSRAFHCWSKLGHGDIALAKAIERSCNVYFYHVGKLLGANTLAHFSRKLGLGDPIRIHLPRIARGLVPDPAWKKENIGQPWYQGETLNFAIGQGYLAVTPLQVLRLITILANDGVVVEPSLIKGIAPHPRALRVSKKNITAIKGGMLKAVEAKYGTCHLAKLDFVRIAAKTGTAQNKGEPHAWFAGFFPYDTPRMAMVVVVEHGGTGGVKAAGIAREAATIWYNLDQEYAAAV